MRERKNANALSHGPHYNAIVRNGKYRQDRSLPNAVCIEGTPKSDARGNPPVTEVSGGAKRAT